MEQPHSHILDLNPLKSTFRMTEKGPSVRSRLWYDKIVEWTCPEKYEKQKCRCLVALANGFFSEQNNTKSAKFIFTAVATLKSSSNFFEKLLSCTIKIECTIEKSGVFRKNGASETVPLNSNRAIIKGQFYLQNSSLLQSLYDIKNRLNSSIHMKSDSLNGVLQAYKEAVSKMSEQEKNWLQETVGPIVPLLQSHIEPKIKNETVFCSAREDSNFIGCIGLLKEMCRLDRSQIENEKLILVLEDVEDKAEFMDKVEGLKRACETQPIDPSKIFAFTHYLTPPLPRQIAHFFPTAILMAKEAAAKIADNPIVTRQPAFIIYKDFFEESLLLSKTVAER